MATPNRTSSLRLSLWQKKAARRIPEILEVARTLPRVQRAWKKLHFKKGRRTLPPWRAEVEVVGTQRMRRLNREFRQTDSVTDIISLEAPTPFQQQGLLGEMVLCLPVLERQARERRHSLTSEMDILLVHGILHLLGWDHEKGSLEERNMAQLEGVLLKRLGRTKNLAGLIERIRYAT